MQRGLSCIRHLLARAASEIELTEIPGDCIEALGLLMAELGDLASVVLCLATACRRYTADSAKHSCAENQREALNAE